MNQHHARRVASDPPSAGQDALPMSALEVGLLVLGPGLLLLKAFHRLGLALATLWVLGP